MSDFNITIPGGESKRLKTGGKYCPADIVVTAEGGGFTPPEDEVLTPELVYQTTRPAGWLKMPTPTDYECYCLGHIMPGLSSHFYVTVTFTGTCTIEFGSLVNGVFVAKESYTPTSDTFFHKVIQYNDYGDELADGTRQYMVRIYGTNLTELNFNRTEQTVPGANVVDIVCGIALSKCNVNSYNNNTLPLYSLKYLNFVGKGKPGGINGDAFAGGGPALLSVGCEAKNDSTHCLYSLAFCNSLIAAAPNLFASANYTGYAFRSSGIKAIKIGGIRPLGTEDMFRSSALVKFTAETLDTSLSSNLANMFCDCNSLKSVTDLDISSATNVSNLFAYCLALIRLTFAGETTPGGWTISLTNTMLDHDALVEMIASLPTATATATITITGVPGASELTDAEIAVATAKNWTITR